MGVLPLAERAFHQLVDEGEPRRPFGVDGGEGAADESVAAGQARLDLGDRAGCERRIALLDDLLGPMR